MNSKLLLLLTIGLAAAGFAVGCGGGDDAPAAMPTATEKVADEARGEPRSETAEKPPSEARQVPAAGIAEQLRTTIEIPDYYPEDGPLYPGVKPSQTQQSNNGRVSLVFGTDETPDEASSVMNEAAEAKGWTIVSENQMERGLMTMAEKDGRKMTILTSRMDGGSGDAVTLVAVSVDP